jgi:hypothetical protein
MTSPISGATHGALEIRCSLIALQNQGRQGRNDKGVHELPEKENIRQGKGREMWAGEKYRMRMERLKLGETDPRQLNHFLGSHGARPSALCLLKLGKKDVDAATSPGMMVER